MESEIDAWKKRAMKAFTRYIYTERNFLQLTPREIAERMVDATIAERPKEPIMEEKMIVKKTLEKVLTFRRYWNGEPTGHISRKKVKEWLRRL